MKETGIGVRVSGTGSGLQPDNEINETDEIDGTDLVLRTIDRICVK